MNAAIELQDVHVYFGDYEILSGLSVAFREGESTCIVGKAGSGKSTMLKTAAGLVIPERGRVLYRGKDLGRMNRAEELTYRKESAFAFQDAALWANQTIYSNLALPLAVHESQLPKTESDRRIVEIARRAGYSEGLGSRPSDLSAGEQKLISLARALILDPWLLFLDEPTASLDEDAVDTLIGILAELKAAGKTLIAVTHDARLIARIADRLCVVAAGKVVGVGPVEEVAPLIGGELFKSIRAAKGQFASLDGRAGGA